MSDGRDLHLRKTVRVTIRNAKIGIAPAFRRAEVRRNGHNTQGPIGL